MFNEVVKQKYLETLKGIDKRQSKHSRALKLFNAVSSYEEMESKDIAEICKGELVFCLRRTVGVVYTTKSDMREAISCLRKYKEWYFHNVKNKNSILIEKQFVKGEDIDYSGYYYLKFVKDDAQFLEFAKMIFQKYLTENPDVYYGLLITLLLIFNGIPLKEIENISRDDMDFITQTIAFYPDGKKDSLIKISMLPCFISYYKKINFDSKGKFNPLKKEIKKWSEYFSYRFSEITRDSNFQKNLKLNFLNSPPLPVVINLPLVKLNGQLVRVYFQQKHINSNFMFKEEVMLRDFNYTFENFLKAFYI